MTVISLTHCLTSVSPSGITLVMDNIGCLQDHRRKVDFVLVYEEDKKDVDIEIPKVRKIISTMT